MDGCHTGVSELFAVGKAVICAGRERDVLAHHHEMALVISLLGTERPRSERRAVVKVSKSALALLPSMQKRHVTRAPFMGINWPDGGVPDTGRKFWEDLVTDLRAIEGRVLLYCMGGHGRTGTALALLAGIEGVYGPDDVVEALRVRYCSHIVETRAQVQFLNRMGVATKVKPSYEMVRHHGVQSGWTQKGGGAKATSEESTLARLSRTHRGTALDDYKGHGLSGGSALDDVLPESGEDWLKRL